MCNGFHGDEGKEADLRTAYTQGCDHNDLHCERTAQASSQQQTLTMHARLLMRSALSTKPKAAGGTCGSLGGCVTPCTTRE